MSKKKLKTLANLARAAGVFMALLAAGTAVVWSRFPERVDAFEAWLHGRLVASYRDAWQAARDESDPARQASQLEALLARLDHVRNGDHLAEVVLDCLHRLTDLARARGDLPTAIEWMRAAVVFDDHDVANAAALGDLLGQQPDKRQEGIHHLTQLDAQFPAHPLVLPVLVRHLIAGGQARAALQALEASSAAVRSNLWTIQWDDGSGVDADAGADVMPCIDGERFRLRCLIGPGWTRLRFVLPAFASFTLQEPRLTLVAGDAREVLDVANSAKASGDLLVGPGRLEATGGGSPWCEVALPRLGTGPVDAVLEARWQPNCSQALAAPATAPEMAALADELEKAGAAAELAALRRWRLAALRGAMALSWRTASEDFSTAHRSTIAAPFATMRDKKTIDAAFPVPAGATEVRLDLPPFVGYRYRLVAREPAGLRQTGTHDLAVDADGTLRTTGAAPSLTFAAPDGTLASLRFVGEVR